MKLSIFARKSVVILVIVCVVSAGLRAQENNGKSWRLSGVKATGFKRFNEAQVIAAAGLRSGENVTLEQVDAAAARLSDLGTFSTVAYKYKFQKDEIEVTFEVADAKTFFTCTFDNFVWFSDQELMEALERQVPLFDGTAPPDGSLLDEMTRTLEGLLRARKLEGNVMHILSADFSSGARGILFRIEGLSLSVREVRFPGASPAVVPLLQREVSQLLGQPYSRSSARKFASVGLIPVYRRRGHLGARLRDTQASLVEDTGAGKSHSVAVSFTVEEGPIYSWDKSEWTGNQVFSIPELDAILGMKAKEVANGQKIDEGMETIQRAYAERGYMDLRMSPRPALDNEKRLVSYRVTVAEGPQYRMGELSVFAPSGSLKERLLAAWKLKPGEPYNASHIQDFLKNTVLKVVARSGVAVKEVKSETRPNREKLTVNVTIQLK